MPSLIELHPIIINIPEVVIQDTLMQDCVTRLFLFLEAVLVLKIIEHYDRTEEKHY